MSPRLLMLLVLAAPALASLTGCAAAVVAGAGAVGGYVAHKEGYRVQSPVTKTSREEDQR